MGRGSRMVPAQPTFTEVSMVACRQSPLATIMLLTPPPPASGRCAPPSLERHVSCMEEAAFSGTVNHPKYLEWFTQDTQKKLLENAFFRSSSTTLTVTVACPTNPQSPRGHILSPPILAAYFQQFLYIPQQGAAHPEVRAQKRRRLLVSFPHLSRSWSCKELIMESMSRILSQYRPYHGFSLKMYSSWVCSLVDCCKLICSLYNEDVLSDLSLCDY